MSRQVIYRPRMDRRSRPNSEQNLDESKLSFDTFFFGSL